MSLIDLFYSKEDLTERQTRLHNLMVFLLKLSAAGLVFQLILFLYPDTTGFQAFLAVLTEKLTDPLLVEDLSSSGIYVMADEVTYVISQDCLGWKSMSVFTGLVFAASSKLRDHLGSIFAGVAIIFLLNIIRIVTTLYLSHLGFLSFEVVHDLFWKWSLTFAVLLMWVFWFERIRENEPEFWYHLRDIDVF